MPLHRLPTHRGTAPLRTRTRSRAGRLTVPALAGALGLTLVAATLSTPALAATKKAAPRDTAAASQISVSVAAQGTPGETIPTDFLGLSVEKRLVARSQTDGRYGNLAGLLRSIGTGVLRFGGDSADSTAFLRTPTETPPSWSTDNFTAADYDRLATLTQASGWRVILAVNLAHYDPQRAADEVAAAAARLGTSLQAVEVGNEPNAYVARQLRPAGWSVADYQNEFAAYRTAIAAVAPGVPLVGPNSYVPFVQGFDPGLGTPGAFVDQHLYPLNNCAGPTPSISTLLNRVTANREASEIRAGVAVADAHNLPLRIAETNSIICSGTPGVSNSHGSALWGVDYLGIAASNGAAAVNLHGGLQLCGQPTSPAYTPLCAATPADLANNVFTAQPIWYAMAAMRPLVNTTFVPVALSTVENVSVRATRDATGVVRVVLDDMNLPGSNDTAFRLSLPPGYDEALVTRLTGPSQDATSGTVLGGALVAPNGSLTPGRPDRVLGKTGVTTVRMPAGSAAVVTLTPHCTVPALKGLTGSQARVRLASGGCKAGVVAMPKGAKAGDVLMVKSQKLSPGFRYRVNQPVAFQLIVKPKPVKPATPVKSATPQR